MRHPVPLTLAGLALVAMAACSSDASTTAADDTPAAAETSAPATTPTPTSDATADASTGAAAVDIDDFRFVPETITVAVGDEVTWTNQDATRHTVTAGSGDEPQPDTFDLDVEAQGDTVSHTFDEPGSYAYFCELHPFMVGTVEVTS